MKKAVELLVLFLAGSVLMALVQQRELGLLSPFFQSMTILSGGNGTRKCTDCTTYNNRDDGSSDYHCRQRTKRLQQHVSTEIGTSDSPPPHTPVEMPQLINRQCARIERACLLENEIVLMGRRTSEKFEELIEEPVDILLQSIHNPYRPGDISLVDNIQGVMYNLPGWHDGLNGTQKSNVKFPLSIRVHSSMDPPELAKGISEGQMVPRPLVLLWKTWPYNFNECGKWLFDFASHLLKSGTTNSNDNPEMFGMTLVPPRRTGIASFLSLLGPPITPSMDNHYDMARHCPNSPAPCFEEIYICDNRMQVPRATSEELEETLDRMVEGSCSRATGQGRKFQQAGDKRHRIDELRIWIDNANRPGTKKREILNPDDIMGFCKNNTITVNGRDLKMICQQGRLTDSSMMACAIRTYDVLIAITGASVANALFLRKGGSIIQVEYEAFSDIAAEDNWGGQPLFNRLDTLQPLHYKAPEEDTEENPLVPWCREEKNQRRCGGWQYIAKSRDSSVRVRWERLKPLLEKAVQFRDRYDNMAEQSSRNEMELAAQSPDEATSVVASGAMEEEKAEEKEAEPKASTFTAQEQAASNQAKNEDVVNRMAFISPVNLSFLRDGTPYFMQRDYGALRFEEMTLASLDTWLGGKWSKELFFLVINESQRDDFHSKDYCGSGSKYEHYCQRLVPIFTDCPGDGDGSVVCCKLEKGLQQVYDSYGDKFDWFVYMDDDHYVRPDLFMEYVKPLDPLDSVVLASGRPYGWLSKLGEAGIWAQAAYQCSSDVEYRYPWTWVSAYSQGALKHIYNGLRAGGLLDQCREYGVISDSHSLSQDAGGAIFNWMFSLPTIPIGVADNANATRSHHFAAHARFGGNPKQSAMRHIHDIYKRAPPAESYKFTYRWHNVTGFHQTALYKEYGDPSSWTSWHTMNVSDCLNHPNKSEGPLDLGVEPYTNPWDEKIATGEDA